MVSGRKLPSPQFPQMTVPWQAEYRQLPQGAGVSVMRWLLVKLARGRTSDAAKVAKAIMRGSAVGSADSWNVELGLANR